MSDDHTLANSAIRSLGRVRDIKRIHGSTKKEKKEDRKKREKEFRELLEQGAKEPEEFAPEQTFEKKIQVESKTMLSNLSTGAAHVNFVEEEKQEDTKTDEKKDGEEQEL